MPKYTLLALLLLSVAPLATAEDRIDAARQTSALEVKAQHREIVTVQPISHLTAEEEAAHQCFLLPRNAPISSSTCSSTAGSPKADPHSRR